MDKFFVVIWVIQIFICENCPNKRIGKDHTLAKSFSSNKPVFSEENPQNPDL